MSFLVPTLAFGAFAFLIPLVIHLLHRSRFTTVDWGAMHLLASVVRVNRRRMQITNWLLLLLRCLIPILLAFCLAAPLLTGCQALQGDAPTSYVLVIDDSRSMSAATDNGRSPISEAKQQLKALLANMTRRDEVIMVRSSRIGAPAGSMGAATAIKRLAEIRARSGPIELGRMLEAAVDAASTARHANRRVLIVSDFQSNSVGPATLETINRMASSKMDAAVLPVFSFLNLGGNADQLRNVSVDSVEVESPAMVAGRSARFSARVRNASDLPANDLRVVWSIDGQPLQPRMISLPPRSSTTNRLSRAIDDPGLHEITVAVEHGDAISDDNRRSIAVDVLDEINVVIVDEKPSKEPLSGHADFLTLALSPFAFGGDDQPDPVRAEVVTERELNSKMETRRPEIVVLANVAKPQEATRSLLASFVLDGGSLVVFDGEDVDPDSYNQPWNGEKGTLRLPAQMGEIVGNTAPIVRDSTQSTEESPIRIGEINSQYTPWKLLSAGDIDPFDDVELRAYRNLVAETGEAKERDGGESRIATRSTVLLREQSGRPIVLTNRQGDGQIVQFAIPANDSWSNLPLRLVYLPMMQQMVMDLAGKNDSATISVGTPIAISLAELETPDDGSDDESDAASNREDPSGETGTRDSFSIMTPDGDFSLSGPEQIASANGGSDEKLIWTATHRPGLYRIRRTTSDVNSPSEPPKVSTTLRVAEVSPAESQLRDVEESRIANVAETLQAKIYTEAFEFQGDDQVRRYGRPVWRWFLAALLVVLIAEVWLQQNLVRRSAYARAGS